jgi:hypothetical protein
MRMKDVVEERLIEPDRPKAPGRVPHEHFEDAETRTAGWTNPARKDLAGNRGGETWLQRVDRLKMSAVLISDREAIQQVFDGFKTDAPEVGRPARADALQILQRPLQRMDIGQRQVRTLYCRTVAVPVPTRISLMRAGS